MKNCRGEHCSSAEKTVRTEQNWRKAPCGCSWINHDIMISKMKSNCGVGLAPAANKRHIPNEGKWTKNCRDDQWSSAENKQHEPNKTGEKPLVAALELIMTSWYQNLKAIVAWGLLSPPTNATYRTKGNERKNCRGEHCSSAKNKWYEASKAGERFLVI